MREITLLELARLLNGELEGEATRVVSGVAPLDAAGPHQVSFLSNPRYAQSLKSTEAGVVIVGKDVTAPGLNLLRVADPYLGFALAMEIFHQEPYVSTGVSERAFVHPEARIGGETSIHPFAVVCRGASVGSRVTLMPGAYVGPGAEVGDDTVLHPNVVLEKGVKVGRNVIIHAGTVVGSDGFGFAREGQGYRKIIQAGTVRIEDDVEIGALCSIDRAVMGETVIGRGSKLDNLVQLGHNVRLGENCILVAQVGIAGSTELEDNVTMAGQSGVAGHLRVGRGAVVMAKTAVFKDVPAGDRVAGIPAVEAGQWRRTVALTGRLEELRKKVSRLEKELDSIAGGRREEEEK